MRCDLLFYNLPCRRTRHRELQNSDIGDQVHDRFTALDDTREEKVFSFAGGVTSGLELAVWSGFGKNSCRNLTFWVTYFSSGQVARGGN